MAAWRRLLLVVCILGCRKPPAEEVGEPIQVLPGPAAQVEGEMKNGSLVGVVDYTIRNASARPVRLLEAKATCGCTKAELDQSVIAPGGDAKLHATITGLDYVGREVRIIVRTDHPEASELNFSVTMSPGKATPLLLGRSEVDLGRAPPTESRRTIQIVTAETKGTDLWIRSATLDGLPAATIVARPSRADLSRTVERRYYDVAFDAPSAAGPHATTLRLWNADRKQLGQVAVRYEVEPLVSWAPQVVAASLPVSADKTIERSVLVSRPHPPSSVSEPMRVEGVLPGWLEVSISDPTASSTRVLIRISAASLKPGAHAARVRLATGVRQIPAIEIPVEASVYTTGRSG